METGDNGLQFEEDACNGGIKEGKNPLRAPETPGYLRSVMERYEVKGFLLRVHQKMRLKIRFSDRPSNLSRRPIRQTPSDDDELCRIEL